MQQKINIFDFDGTLSNDTWPKFWVWVNKFGYNGSARNDELEAALAEYRKTHAGDHLETFFGFFNDLLQESHNHVTLAELMEGEEYIIYNPGVEHFLANTNSKNYIVSGGLTLFLQNLQIAKYFSNIYGTPVTLDAQGNVTEIGPVMTNAKKIDAIKEILTENNRLDFDCVNVNYIGDGYSDADSMRFIHDHGGKAIFVHQPDNDDEFAAQYNSEIFEKLDSEKVVDYNYVADYQQGTPLFEALN